MRFKAYIKDRLYLLLWILFIILFLNMMIVIDVSINVAANSLIYANALLFVCSSLFLYFIDYRKFEERRKELLYLIDNRINKNEQIYENVYELVEKKQRENDAEIESLREELRDINDYMTHWIHQVKIPIAVLEIIAERVEELEKEAVLSKDINRELDRITALVEQALYISRAGNYSSDFLVEEFNIGKIVKEVIRKNKYLFIYNKIDVEIKNVNYSVLSDKKWIKHIVEQIIHNACKYISNNGLIELFVEETDKAISLHIKDNGIGIVPSDIHRVFEKGFTGENGRNRTKSTGMGLYISKRIMNKLSHDITITSEKGKGTDVVLTFYKLSDYFNVTQM